MTTPRPFGQPLIRVNTVTSTMDIARRLEFLGAPEGLTILAASQSDGRGRSDRGWQSPPNAGLYCSVLLRPNITIDQFQPFSVAAGLALCEALDPDHSLAVQLKWPNDLIVDGRKLAGILVTSSLVGNRVSSAILGFGINLQSHPTQPSTAIALSEIAQVQAPLLPRLTRSLSLRYSAICEGDAESALTNWAGRLAYLGQQVTLQDGPLQHAGTLAGISSTGELCLTIPSGLVRISSGELTRGPRLVDKYEHMF